MANSGGQSKGEQKLKVRKEGGQQWSREGEEQIKKEETTKGRTKEVRMDAEGSKGEHFYQAMAQMSVFP